MPLSIIQSKLIAPSMGGAMIRAWPIPVSHSQRDHLTVLIAPAGYGKTCMVSQTLEQQNTPFTWFNIDANDNHARYFWAYFSSALRPLIPDSDEVFQNLLTQSSSINYLELVDRIIKDLEVVGRRWNKPERFTLVLDNFQHISHSEIMAPLSRFIDYMPHWFRLYILSQTPPAIGLSDRMVKGNAQALTKQHLAFSLDETKHYLQHSFSISVSEAAIQQIHQSTEGWPSLIHILGLSLQSGMPLEKALSSNDGHLSSFLSQQIYNKLPQEEQMICRMLAVPDKFNQALALRLFPEAGPTAFQRFTQQNDIASAIANDHHWYQFNPLFKDWLRNLHESGDIYQADTQRGKVLDATIEFFTEQREIEQALRLATAAKRWAQASIIVEQFYPSPLQLYQAGAIENILSLFPSEVVDTSPYLLVARALYLFSLFRYREALQCIQLLEKELQDLTNDHKSASIQTNLSQESLGLGIDFIRSHMLRFSGNTTEASALTGKLLPILQSQDSPLLCWCYCGLAADYFIRDEIVSSIQYGVQGMALAKKVSDGPCLIATLGWLIPALLLNGQLSLAEEIVDEQLAWLADRGLDYLPDMVLLQSQRVTLYREKCELQKAWALHEELQQHFQDKTDPRNIIHAKYIVYIDLLCASQQLVAARQQLAELEKEVMCNYTSHDFVGLFDIPAMKAILALKMGDPAPLIQWQNHSLPVTLCIPHRDNNLELLRCVADVIQMKDCTSQLQQIAEKAERNGVLWRAIKAEILMSLSYLTQGQIDKAQVVFESALGKGKTAGFAALFVEDLPVLQPLLQKAREKSDLANYINKLLDLGQQAKAGSLSSEDKTSKEQQGDTEGLIEGLTPKEREVLMLLDQGLSNKDIGEKMMISLSTVKNHLRNLYGKFQVKSRTEAIAVARTHDLL